MSAWLASADRRPRVLIAGGGVAALEACLLLRDHVAADDVEIEVLTPAQHFTYRPLSVLEPVGGPQTWSMPLVRFASDQDLDVVHDELSEVHPERRTVTTTSGVERRYDLLLVAIGARPVPHLPGAVTFFGAVDAPAVRRMLDDAARLRHTVAFAVGTTTSWPLPLYELALLAATDLRARGAKARLTLVTPEATPLALFGPEASGLVAQLLDDHGIEVVCEAEALAAEDGRLRLVDGRRLLADRVVTLPRPAGRFVGGLPHDAAGFIPVDAHGRVGAVERVYAAGDITTFPLKQGGLATQQADAAAEAMLADLGLPIEPRPFSPVLQGMLYGGDDPTYLRTPLDQTQGAPSSPRTFSLWWPPSKIAGRYLSSYLALRAGAPRTPEVRPSADVVPVRVELGAAATPVPHTGDSAG
jgi:sulfide:quinone oxidoreductase